MDNENFEVQTTEVTCNEVAQVSPLKAAVPYVAGGVVGLGAAVGLYFGFRKIRSVIKARKEAKEEEQKSESDS